MMTAAALTELMIVQSRFSSTRDETLLKKNWCRYTDKYGLAYMVAFGYRKADQQIKKQEETSKILLLGLISNELEGYFLEAITQFYYNI
jgi:hypothetical protein